MVKSDRHSHAGAWEREKHMPAIRFEGFSEVWEECSLSKFVSSLDAGVSVNSGEKPADENEFGILKTSCVTNGVFEPYENKVVFETEEINRLKEPVLKNTIIISRMNTPALVGANAYIDKDFDNYFLPDRLWAAKPSTIGDLQFIAYVLGSANGRAALSELATGTSGSMKNISKPAVFGLKFQAPSKKEQTKVGNYFQQLDTLIAQHQQKHDKLLNLKKALLEKMFPRGAGASANDELGVMKAEWNASDNSALAKGVPEIRFKGFSGAWEEKALEDVGNSTSGTSIESEFVNNGKYKVISIGSYSEDSVYTDQGIRADYSKKTKNRILNKNDLTMILNDKTLAGNIIGRVLLINESNAFIYNQRTQRIEPYEEKYDSQFLYQLLNAPLIREKIFKNSQGNTQIYVNWSAIKKLIYLIPKTKEQTKIGNLFKNLDTLINQHQSQLKKLGNIKQACLAKMFV